MNEEDNMLFLFLLLFFMAAENRNWSEDQID